MNLHEFSRLIGFVVAGEGRGELTRMRSPKTAMASLTERKAEEVSTVDVESRV